MTSNSCITELFSHEHVLLQDSDAIEILDINNVLMTNLHEMEMCKAQCKTQFLCQTMNTLQTYVPYEHTVVVIRVLIHKLTTFPVCRANYFHISYGVEMVLDKVKMTCARQICCGQCFMHYSYASLNIAMYMLITLRQELNFLPLFSSNGKYSWG